LSHPKVKNLKICQNNKCRKIQQTLATAINRADKDFDCLKKNKTKQKH
jgi:hypothetical protein